MPHKDWFADAFGRAIADVREKLIEEPWFGRPLGPAGEHARPHESIKEADPALDRIQEDEHDRGIDR